MSRGRPRPSFLSGRKGREIKRAIAVRKGSHCLYCGIPFEDPGTATLDHFIPVVLWPRGINKRRNWVLACDPCNNRKGASLPLTLAWLLLANADALLTHHRAPLALAA
jgi:5-methylcytosine-specific restriction endonuclease McrA